MELNERQLCALQEEKCVAKFVQELNYFYHFSSDTILKTLYVLYILAMYEKLPMSEIIKMLSLISVGDLRLLTKARSNKELLKIWRTVKK